MIFYAGFHEPAALDLGYHRWPAALAGRGYPLFFALPRVAARRRWSDDQGLWACDNGAFASIMSGAGVPTPADVVDRWRIMLDRGARPAWLVAPDCPAHPVALAAAGISAADAVARTVDGYLYAADAGLGARVVPVLTGETLGDYEACLDGYHAAGAVEDGDPVAVGALLGRPLSLVRDVLGLVRSHALRAHVLGVKGATLTEIRERWTEDVASVDSMSWSYEARRQGFRLDDSCPHPGDCRNCLAWAVTWAGEQTRPLTTQLALAL